MNKWADYMISAVRYDSSHEKIESVRTHEDEGDKMGIGYYESRQKVVSNIEKGFTYSTVTKRADGRFNRGEEIHIIEVDCTKYIRTDRNKTNKDNLENLHEF